MHQDPEHEDYDDDEYNYYPEYNEYGYPSKSKKFDVDWAAWEQWLSKAIKDIVEEDNNVWVFGHNLKPSKKFPVSDSLPKGTLNDKCFVFLGNNHYDEAIWKTKYFAKNEINLQYKNHISSHAAHFVKQPNYYQGLFDILN